LAGALLYAAFSKVFALNRNADRASASPTFACAGLPPGVAAAFALLEFAGAVCILLPMDLWPPHVFLRLVAAGLALLMVVQAICRVRRHEPSAKIVVVFLLALFVIVGLWP
jgi:uncharacterized membrane protein YphA (DoxX/SURF4 family)